MSADGEIGEAFRAIVAAAWAKHRIDPVDCALCGETVPGEHVHAVWITNRVVEGRVLWMLGELWCMGCARLARGLEAARHVSLPKGTG